MCVTESKFFLNPLYNCFLFRKMLIKVVLDSDLAAEVNKSVKSKKIMAKTILGILRKLAIFINV